MKPNTSKQLMGFAVALPILQIIRLSYLLINHTKFDSLKYCLTFFLRLSQTKAPRLITHYSLLIAHCSLLITCYLLLTTYYSLLITHYSLLITYYSLLITHYSLLITHYLSNNLNW